MSHPYVIHLYHKQRLDFSEEFETPVELGRQRHPSEQPFVRYRDDRGWRVAIARLDESLVSRRHIRLEPVGNGRIRLENVSDRNTIQLNDGAVIAAGQSCELMLPLSISIGERVIRIDPVGDTPDDQEMHSLAAPTLVPGDVARMPKSASLTLAATPDKLGESFVAWLQAVTSMLQSSATPAEYFERAARGIVELISLDTGAVLVPEGGEWRVAELKGGERGPPGTNWRPSRRILTNVAAQKRTMWLVPGQSESLDSYAGVQAMVAAPILNQEGGVVAILYGDRRMRLGMSEETPISKLEAMLVETLACSVATGLARIEQEHKILAAQIRFEQFFTPELSQQLAIQPDLLNGRDAEVSIMFCDIRGFSRISERLGPSATGDWIGSVLNMLSDCVLAQQGVLVDYLGDELMAMWGSPIEQPEHAQLACRAALDMARQLPELNARWQPVLGEPLRIGIGINTGIARVGNTGSARKFKYGPLGNTVNLASRVQGATKYVKADLLITAATRNRLGPHNLPTRRVCHVRVVNIAEPVELYQLSTDDSPVWQSLCEHYEGALQAFYKHNFRQAAKLLGNILDQHPDDGPALLLLSRTVERLLNPAREFPPEWDLPGK